MTSHIKTKSIRDGFTNMAIERYHNEMREKLKTCRGLGNDDSAAIFANLLYIHHNFVRPHMGLDGRTPAEEAGAITARDARGKYRSLITNAAVADLPNNMTLARRLRRYADMITIDAREDNVPHHPQSMDRQRRLAQDNAAAWRDRVHMAVHQHIQMLDKVCKRPAKDHAGGKKEGHARIAHSLDRFLVICF